VSERKRVRTSFGRTVVGAVLATALVMGSVPPVLAQSASPTPPPQPKVGEVVKPFDAQAVDGTAAHIAYGEGVTVLLFFLSGCPVCHKMIPEWNASYPRRGKNVRVIGVLMDQEPPGFFQAMPFAFPVVRSPSRAFLNSYNVYQAPTAIRIGPGGKVLDATVGWVDRMRVGELFRQ
jgi:peroxiredoxin